MSALHASISDHARGVAALAVRSVTVEYPGVRALDGVTAEFRAGEIHAVVGENGAGKSTLMKVLSGSVRPSAGEVLAGGRSVAFAKPSEALRAGIAMVHQELNLVPTLTVADNVMLGREPLRMAGLAVHGAAQKARAGELLALLGAEVAVTRLAGGLSVAEAQFVEIAKCLASEARVLIFDEPTAVLGEHEAARLLALMRRLRDEGRAVIFISHHLEEVVTVADRISVLRDGRLVQEFARAADGAIADEAMLAHAMVGRELGSIYPPKGAAREGEGPAIELIGFGAEGRSCGVSLAVRPGEIVGLAGLVGSGRTETAEAIVGVRRAAGALRVGGRESRYASPHAARKGGVAYVSEDRKGRGLHVTLSSVANMTLPSLDAHVGLGGARIDRGGERAVTARWIAAFGIRCARSELPISSLSGGNQQKFALARWLETRPRVLLIDEPTRGVDVGAKAEIYRIIAGLAAEGLACIVISSELPELIGLSHRVVVMREGSPAGEVSRDELAAPGCEELIVRLASGLGRASPAGDSTRNTSTEDAS
ncbi:MAG: sugar ABC transporter ATP-binding protein [Planctomycetota bacterium]